MIKKFGFWVSGLLALCLVTCVMAAPSALQMLGNANKPIPVPTPPSVNAKAYILLDANSGRVLAEKGADDKLNPASLTKMMTLYIVSDALKQARIHLDDKVTVSEKAWRTGGSRMFIKVGDTVPVEQLIQGVIVQSGNDACVALAEHVAGNENSFADLMNEQAQLLGMKNSHFTDSTGMPDPNHYSTARDLANLATHLVMDFPEYYHYYKEKWFTFNGIKQPNRNRLLWRDATVDGIKTGHTEDAGYCLVSSAKTDDMRLVSVVMGASTDAGRADDSQRLLTYGFRFYETHRLYQGGQTLANERVWYGQNNSVPLSITKEVYVTIPRGSYKQLQANIEIPGNLMAPISKGQTLGTLNVKLGDQSVVQIPLIAAASDPQAGVFKRMKDSVHLTFKHWFGTRDKDKLDQS